MHDRTHKTMTAVYGFNIDATLEIAAGTEGATLASDHDDPHIVGHIIDGLGSILKH
jgi:hypothetical protein